MKYCSNCGAELAKDAKTCEACGAVIEGAALSWDHTSEFDAEDIANNKIFALLGYLLSFPGFIITYLAAKDSPYAMFHAKQALKIEVTELLILVATCILCWTCIVPVAAIILSIILCVVDIIAIFQVFMGLAKEPWLVRSISFLGR